MIMNMGSCVLDSCKIILTKVFSMQRQSGPSATQEEDEDSTFTQPSTTQVQKGLEKLTPAQVDQKVTDAQKRVIFK